VASVLGELSAVLQSDRTEQSTHGLSVSAVRFYSDAGIVTPTGHTDAGYRLYDIQAIDRLEFVRTLRELGSGLDDIRRLLAG
jgi:DNA-binding transcriptional MerR regulator